MAPHHMCGVGLCSMWHFVLCREWILEVALQIQEVAPTMCVAWHFTLCGEWIQEVAPTTCVVWHFAPSSIQDPPDVSTIVGYILVIPTPGMLCRTLVLLCY